MLLTTFAFAFLLLAEPGGGTAGEQAANALSGNLQTLVWHAIVILIVGAIFGAISIIKQWAFSLSQWGGYVITFFNDGLAAAMIYLIGFTLIKGLTAGYISSLVQQSVIVFLLGGAGGALGWWKWGDVRYTSEDETAGFGETTKAEEVAAETELEDA